MQVYFHDGVLIQNIIVYDVYWILMDSKYISLSTPNNSVIPDVWKTDDYIQNASELKAWWGPPELYNRRYQMHICVLVNVN